MRKFLLKITFFLFCIAAFLAIPDKVLSARVSFLSSEKAEEDSITVYIFLLESCPICQSLTIEMKNLYSKFSSKGITFVGLFPNETLSTTATIKKFGKKYDLPFEMRLDENQKLVKRFSATTTPEVFVVRNSDKAVLYKGCVDNSYVSLGRRRTVITEHYLDSALESLLLNRSIDPAVTKPVGCFIFK